MKNKSLENFIENSWNFAKEVINKPVIKGVAFLSILGLYENSDAQVNSSIDSIRVTTGYAPESRGPQAFTEPIWELKNGVPQIRDTVDFGILKIDAPPWTLPSLVYGSGFGVDYTDTKWDTILVTGKVYRHPENTPIEGAGVNLWNAYES